MLFPEEFGQRRRHARGALEQRLRDAHGSPSFHTHAGHDNQKATTRVEKTRVASLGENLSLKQPNRSIREIILILTIRLSLYHVKYLFCHSR